MMIRIGVSLLVLTATTLTAGCAMHPRDEPMHASDTAAMTMAQCQGLHQSMMARHDAEGGMDHDRMMTGMSEHMRAQMQMCHEMMAQHRGMSEHADGHTCGHMGSDMRCPMHGDAAEDGTTDTEPTADADASPDEHDSH